MGADVRIEIIYFKQDSDIKLEFGLSSDYPIRLLSSRVSDEVSFLKRLKTASLRSPIIITVGGFCDDTYLPEIVAKATNLQMTEMDSGKYKSENTGTVLLPSGAVPIIYSDGSFNGCVIESGPQSIIMLPEDDTNRMKLLKELIIPYISEHYRVYDLEETDMAEEQIAEQKVEEAEPKTEENIDSQTELIEFEELDSGEQMEYSEVPLNIPKGETLDDFFLDYENEEEILPKTHNKTNKKKNRGLNFIIALTTILLVASVVVLGYCGYKYFL